MYHTPINAHLTQTIALQNGGHVDSHSLCETTGTGHFCSSSQSKTSVRIAATDDQRKAANRLINRMYSWRGYGNDHVIPVSSNHVTFNASLCCRATGTITLAVDSAGRLAADTLFQDELDVYRSRKGARICELTKLAFDAPESSKALLAALFHSVFIYGYRRYLCTDLFIEVNPRHRRFYQAMLGFEVVGSVRHHAGVDAPAQLMHLSISKIRDSIDAMVHGDISIAVKSLYPLFFKPQQEDEIYLQLEHDELRLTNKYWQPANRTMAATTRRRSVSRSNAAQMMNRPKVGFCL